MAKDAETIQLRWMDLNNISRRMLSDMADVVRDLDEENELKRLQPIDVARGLVAIDEKLRNWTKRTMRLSARAIQVRDIFKRARDPSQLLFDDIPALVNSKKVDISDKDDIREIVSIVKEGLQELVLAYPLMVHWQRDMLLAELQVAYLSRDSILYVRQCCES